MIPRLLAAARHWLRAQADSVTVVTSWGRMWLAMLGLYEYEGINPLSPETVLLPRWVPVHPDRLYVHTRLIYFALSCLYARRVRFDLGLAGLRASQRNCTGAPMSPSTSPPAAARWPPQTWPCARPGHCA